MTPSWLPASIPEAIDYYRDAVSLDCSADTLKEIKRNLIRGDLFYLLAYACGRKDMMHPWIFDRCREVQKNPNGYIDLWSREHHKTSIISFGLTLQDILNDPDITFGLFSHTRPIAKGLVRQLKRELEMNIILKENFDDILYQEPHKQSPQWSEDSGIVVKRTSNPKEATIEGYGLVDGQPIGKHYKVRVYDDTVVPESVSTAEQIQKTTSAFELSDNLGVIGGHVRIIGTRYHLSDTYASILGKGVAKPRIYPATSSGRMDGKPVLFTSTEWERRKKVQSRKIIAAQLLQNPLADEDARFQPLWLTAYEIRPAILNIAIIGDPSLGRHKHSDNTAIVVIGYSKGGVKYLLDGVCHRMSLSQRWTALKNLYVKWSAEPGIRSVTVGWEQYGLQADLEYFEERMRVDTPKVVFNIEEVNWVREGEQSKEDRIDRLEPDFRNRRLLLPLAVWQDGRACTWRVEDDPESKLYQSIVYKDFVGLSKKQQDLMDGGNMDLIAKAIKKVDSEKQVYDVTVLLIEEFLQFPFAAHDDLLDSASRFYDLDMTEPVTHDKKVLDGPIYYDS